MLCRGTLGEPFVDITRHNYRHHILINDINLAYEETDKKLDDAKLFTKVQEDEKSAKHARDEVELAIEKMQQLEQPNLPL